MVSRAPVKSRQPNFRDSAKKKEDAVSRPLFLINKCLARPAGAARRLNPTPQDEASYTHKLQPELESNYFLGSSSGCTYVS